MQEIKDYEYDPFYLIGIQKGEEEGIEKGIEIGEEKGKVEGATEANIFAIRNMTVKKFEKTVIADLLGVEIHFVEKVQRQLKKEPKIMALIHEGATTAQIAKAHRVSALFVEAIRKAAQLKVSEQQKNQKTGS